VRPDDQTIGTPQDRALATIIDGLQRVGYRGALLQENYAFSDWFTSKQERQLSAAAFGQTPVSYESACLGVVRSNGVKGQELVNGYRAFGAPLILEIDSAEVREWAVSRVVNTHSLLASYPLDYLPTAFAKRAQEWQPQAILRAKNIAPLEGGMQLSLFSGLLPELENRIQDELDPLLRDTLYKTKRAYLDTSGRNPDEEQIFKLVFWILTAKVFHDRRIDSFTSLSGTDPDEVLAAVAKHYRTDVPRLLNKAARETATECTWNALDFRNLSVEVLSQIWSNTLVDKDTRRKLGIHRTSRTIVRYIVERVPFSPFGDDKRVVFEPCSGSAAFLIGAMQALRPTLFGASPQERHDYFVKHLVGAEYEPFGVEISTLALTLADFPNPAGWNMVQQDVFLPGAMRDVLRRAGVVLCNPPFESFEPHERALYHAKYPTKPAELLGRVLDDLHPSGVLGFVLPYVAVDGKGYKEVRDRLAKRFASLELTVLPDRAFQGADAEVALVIAKDPIPHDVCRVTYRRVDDNAEAWTRFEREHEVSVDYSANFGTESAREGFTIPALQDVWGFLVNHPRLGSVADVHRGLEWKTGRPTVLNEEAPDYRLGVAPQTDFKVFEVPRMSYLSFRPEDQRRNSWQYDWIKPKAIFSKFARSRGNWRLAAFADRRGVACFQTYIAAWPADDAYDAVMLAAVLNGPVANAFVATREGKTDITMQTLRLIPMPVFTPAQGHALRTLVARYESAIQSEFMSNGPSEDLERLLMEIDAVVLDGYRMPSRLERQVLEFFRGHERRVSHPFGDYLPRDCEVMFPLSTHLDPQFASANAGEVLKRLRARQRP